MKNEKSIHQLIVEQNSSSKEFLVPSYQRGYRWQRVNVSDLLNDLFEFIHNDKETYSLQPLVVYDSNEKYHVVDGQQRLTTLSILLGYLGLPQIRISYESRKEHQVNNYVEDCKNIDQYHVNLAYLTIKNWFEKIHPEEVVIFKNLLSDKLGNKRVKFIWYCTTDDEVATFIRLNKDKISLTNAELIKALLLKEGNFPENTILRQKSIAIEWNKIENTFNDDAFWGFIRPLEDNRATRVDFLFEIIKDKNLLSYVPKEDTGNDQYTTFRYFYQYFKDKKESSFQQIWDKVNQLYNVFLHWYNEIEVYHYIGFLIIDNPNCITELLDEWLKAGMTIDDFKQSLKTRINNVIEQKGCNNLSKQYKYNEERATDKTACKPILLLFNIQRIIILNRNLNKDSDTQLFNKFPFYLYKLENWNVEHIASNTDNDFSKTDAQKEWLKTFLLDQSISESHKNEIKEFVKNESPDKSKFDEIRQNLVEEQEKALKKEERLNDSEKNQIWNFCLLDEHTNKSYQNSIFPVKRRIVMGKEMGKKYELDDDLNETTAPNKIAFVPGCTKDAFIKAYTANDTSNREWSRTDAKAYRQEMYECLKAEFNVVL
jgi:hypothetical protein